MSSACCWAASALSASTPGPCELGRFCGATGAVAGSAIGFSPLFGFGLVVVSTSSCVCIASAVCDYNPLMPILFRQRGFTRTMFSRSIPSYSSCSTVSRASRPIQSRGSSAWTWQHRWPHRTDAYGTVTA